MVHNNVALTVSQKEATKVEEEAKRRLLVNKKLSLVVDLDQTIIHATVDPTVAEWQKDEENPNHDAVKDVRSFQLVDDGPGARGCWYYIKLRPGLKEFLENVSKIYELHIYTMGTRAYAKNIANIIDHDEKIFGDRILSRDESGSLVAKNLQRLFPVDTNMVVIIDDRGDVWKWNENLIKVTPYDFFVGIGDINSSFLPKKPVLKASPKAAAIAVPDPNKDLADGATVAEPEPKTNGDSSDSGDTLGIAMTATSADDNVSALEQLVSMGGGDDPTVLQAQTSRQDEALAAQLQDRPLLQKQKQLEAEEDAAAESASPKENGDTHSSNDPDKPRHNLLQDHDTELHHLENSLRRVHHEFYEAYARQLAIAQGGRIAELRGTQSTGKRKVPPNANVDLAMVPDVKQIMPAIKSRVLSNTVIVFSGVVPLGTDIQNSDIALWAKSFGARVEENVGKKTTHVIAARNRTAKVRQAVRKGKGRIKVVGTQWLMDSISQWKKVDETPYLLKIDEHDAAKPWAGDEDDMSSEMGSSAETEAENTEGEGGDKLMAGPRLTIKTGNATDDEDLEGVVPDDLEDEHSPVGGTNEDWSRMHDELAEFLGSDAEDSDADSVASGESGKSVRGRKTSGTKRSHDQIVEAGENGPEANGRKKLAVGRATTLHQDHSQVVGSGHSSSPTPDIMAGEEGERKEHGNGDGAANEGESASEGDGWSEFEGDLEAEMERAASEEHGEG